MHASRTLFVSMLIMHARCEQYDWKQGLQAGSVLSTASDGLSNAQRVGRSCELMTVTWRHPLAAATCLGPESVPTNRLHFASSAASWQRSVRPTSDRVSLPTSCSTAAM